MDKPSTLAVITARGGSKLFPRKNIAELRGKPLIAWSILAAIESMSFDRVVVSTDDVEIAEISKQFGAWVPFLRPAELSGDASPHVPVVMHAVAFVEKLVKRTYEYVMLLQPTSPLRTSTDIVKSIEEAKRRDADAVVSVCEAFSHPFRLKTISPEGWLKDYCEKPKGYLRRQDFPKVYVTNGAIFLVRKDILRDQQTFFPENTFPFLMPQERSIDIDSVYDIMIADRLLQSMERK